MTLFRRYEISEHSMAPALLPGDYLIASRVTKDLPRGSIVVYPHPDRPHFELTKRVIGLPGEHLAVDGGEVEIDGRGSLDVWAVDRSSWSGEWKVPLDAVFVMGDQRLHSGADSRELGPIRLDRLHRVTFRYWPVQRIGRI